MRLNNKLLQYIREIYNKPDKNETEYKIMKNVF